MMGDGRRATHTRHERRPHLRRRIPLAAAAMEDQLK